MHPVPPPETLDAIRQYDTCTIANAIEQFRVRLRNEGFTRPGIRCLTGGSPRLLGFAATCRMRSADPPMTGNIYFDRTDWWTAIEPIPRPRIAVVQDLEAEYGSGSTVGEVHAAILKAFHCEGVITNGAVRDVEAVKQLSFTMFARTAAVSHSYAHIVDYGEPVEIFGLEVRCGDLLYADCHGVISIPREIAAEIPEAAAAIRSREKRIIDFCQSPAFSPDGLRDIIRANS